MACPILGGRKEPCNDSLGGNDAFFAIPFIENGFTIAAGAVTAMNIAITESFKFELRADANIQSAESVSDDNAGTTVFNESFVVVLKKQGAATNVLVDTFHKGLHYIIGRNRNGGYQLMGSLDGARCRAGSATSGGNYADFNWNNLTFTSTSKISAPFLDAATITALLLTVSATNIEP